MTNTSTSTDYPSTSTGPTLRQAVARTANDLQFAILRSPNHSQSAQARATLARLRKYASVPLNDQPLALEEVLLSLHPPLSEKELGRGNAPSASESAAFHALVMFGIHMQSATTDAHVEGQSFARACGRFFAQSESQSTKPRFDAMLVSRDEASRLIHIRSLITLLRGAKIGFDYGQFAQDLRILSARTSTQADQNRRQGVLLRWGRDFAAGAFVKSTKATES
ncbi:type I-E CRISPR-associated protein Cse2/CasB [Corynebacterium hesseae]|uniref:type I-E CRISPR-associated protein Cse2/CasB n=1 Tax=Corynebacterium hesseae TaxID=2913502 RepID=UPI00373E6CB3